MILCPAIVAAGGFGRRLHLGRPKSSLLFDGRPLIWWTARGLRDAGFGPVDVYVDDAEWLARFRAELSELDGVRFFCDAGYGTYYIFRNHCEPTGECLFAYGHAPRIAACYSSLIASNGPLVASTVARTSMRVPLVAGAAGFFEPPFLIRVHELEWGGVSSWHDLFARNAERVVPGAELVVGEFNAPCEVLAYRDYMRVAWRQVATPNIHPSADARAAQQVLAVDRHPDGPATHPDPRRKRRGLRAGS